MSLLPRLLRAEGRLPIGANTDYLDEVRVQHPSPCSNYVGYGEGPPQQRHLGWSRCYRCGHRERAHAQSVVLHPDSGRWERAPEVIEISLQEVIANHCQARGILSAASIESIHLAKRSGHLTRFYPKGMKILVKLRNTVPLCWDQDCGVAEACLACDRALKRE